MDWNASDLWELLRGSASTCLMFLSLGPVLMVVAFWARYQTRAKTCPSCKTASREHGLQLMHEHAEALGYDAEYTCCRCQRTWQVGDGRRWI